jgi:hypothetical protein
MRKSWLVVCCALALGACEARVSTQNPKAYADSVKSMMEKMTSDQQSEFKSALIAIAGDTADPEASFLASTEVTSPLFLAAADKIKGKTAAQILKLGYQTELNLLEKEIADDLGAMQRIKAERQKYGSIFDNIHIDSARYHLDNNGFMTVPVISFAIANGSKIAVKQVYLHGILTSPGRSIPWVSADLNYEFPGGLEPGETKALDLQPNPFGEWKADDNFSRRPDLKMTFAVVNVADASGQTLLKGDPGDAADKAADAATKQKRRAEIQRKLNKIS